MARVLENEPIQVASRIIAQPDTPAQRDSTGSFSSHGVKNYQDHGNRGSVPFPIAIVGMAMRLPGGVNSDKEFWEFLVNKRDGLCRVPETRYNVDAFYDELRPGAVRTKHGHFLQGDISQLDAGFFGMSRQEAEKLDPQQRHLLEVVWECMESCGQTRWRGSNIGLYVGVFGEDWLDLSSKDTQHFDRYRVISAGDFALSNRVSYEYDLRGPSVTLRTGCSSSMVGLHEACQALYAGDCSSALVAGTNLITGPTMTISMSENMVLSQSGICRTFDADADGYGRGEAINVLYIKPLHDALANHDPIRAIIRATAVNCDGKTPTITTPGAEAQERLIRHAYRRAGIDDDEVRKTAFFECHGTGTLAGDMAETSVVGNIFGADGIAIGAVKPNVGHSEGASGITSVIKCVLALEHRTIPPNVHFSRPNPRIPFESAKLHVPVEPTRWPPGRSERVSVNSFGIGGTNAHVILDSASTWLHHDDGSPSTATTTTPSGPHLLLLSAQSKKSLDGQIQNITQYLGTGPPGHDLAYSLARRRDHLQHRAFSILDDNGSFTSFQKSKAESPAVVFVFTGQGAQWPTMGCELMAQFAPFREDIRSMDRALRGLEDGPDWSMEAELSKPEPDSRVGEPILAQPLCTAVQIALVNLLRAWGVRPSSVVGHSSGEIAAAYAAGAFSAPTAIIIAYYRGKLASQVANTRRGAMAAIGMSPDRVYRYLQDGIVVACENSPQSVTLSGDKDALDDAIDHIQVAEPGVFCRRLAINVAYHSHHMKAVAEAYEKSIRPWISHNHSMIPLFSTVTSEQLQDPCQLDATYWSRNLQCQVLFNTAVQRALDIDSRPCILLEIGPHPALSAPIRQIASKNNEKTISYVPTLRRDNAQSKSLLETAGLLYVHGAELDLPALITQGKLISDIPSYAWNHSAYWSETRMVHDWKFRANPPHELLGSRVLECSHLEPSWRCLLHLDYAPWLADHRIGRDIVFPCAGYVAMVGEAVRQITGAEDYTVRNLFMRAALILDLSSATELSTSLRPAKLADNMDSIWYDFTIGSCQGGTWKKHCVGQVRPGPERQYNASRFPQYARAVQSEKWYNTLEQRGLAYGLQFRRLKEISASASSYRAAAIVTDEDIFYGSRYALHPIIIDQSLQLLSVAGTNGVSRRMTRLCIPIGIDRLYIHPGKGLMSIDVCCDKSGGNMSGNADILCEGQVVLSLQKGTFFATQDPEMGQNKLPLASTLHWTPHIDFFPPETLIPPPSNAVDDGRLMVELLALFICEIHDKTRSSSTPIPHLQRYITWMRKQHDLMDEGHPELKTEIQRVLPLDRPARISAIGEIGKIPTQARIGALHALYSRVLDRIIDLLEGRLEPIELLIHDDGLKMFYHVQSLTSRFNEYLELLGNFKPNLRVLEVGGGTGGDTAIALKGLLPESGDRLYSQYTFTDISAGFLPEAKERFKSYPGMAYASLDIARDPIEQGFEAGSFDLIIASNVLHATPRISKSLHNIRKLLAPGGRLLMIELALDVPFIDFIMGILPGWWLGEADGRGERPYVSIDRWQNELVQAGFSGVDCHQFDKSRPYQINAQILSSLPTPEPERDRMYLLYRSNIGRWAQGLEAELRMIGYTVVWHTLQEPPPPGSNVMSLLDLEGPFFDEISKQDFEDFRDYVSCCNELTRILWITRSIQTQCPDPRYGLVLGVARTLRHEVLHEFGTIELDSLDSNAIKAVVKIFESFRNQPDRQVANTNPENEYALVAGSIQVGRYQWSSLEDPLTDRSMVSGTRALDIGAYAMLSSFTWDLTGMVSSDLDECSVEVDIKYVGLNFRDVMIAMGFFDDSGRIGLEGSGIVRRVGSSVKDLQVGDRVMVVEAGLMRTRKVLRADRCLPIPAGLSLEDAATILCVYATVVYSLQNVGNLRKGQSVLIHSACGGVGLAAIQICRIIGAEIYATVGSPEKVHYLMVDLGIDSDHIFDSRSPSFLPGILEKTKGRGVDIVLNSLGGELLHASWRCVASGGKMIELGKRDFLGHAKLDMDLFADNRSFIGVDILQLLYDDDSLLPQLGGEIIEYIRTGRARPISPINIYDAIDIEKAFRHMSGGQHMGKIVVRMPEDQSDLPVSRFHEKASLFSSERSYLLVGGLGGIGRAVATWMVEKGARHLIFFSRSGGHSHDAQAFIRILEAEGCSVTAVAGNVANIDDIQRAVETAELPISGVIQLSMVLRDQGFRKMSHEEWTEVLCSKVQGTWNLHRVFENIHLDFFVLMSSVAGISGWLGQANYAAANTFLDAFVKYRHSWGLPASAIALGLMSDIGYVSELGPSGAMTAALASDLQIVGERHLLQALTMAIWSPSFGGPAQFAVGLGTTKHSVNDDMLSNRFREAQLCGWGNILSSVDIVTTGSRSDELREYMNNIKNHPEILDWPESEERLTQELGKLIASYTSHQDDMTKHEVGSIVIDSLMTFEIRTWFRRHASLEISLVEVSNAETVRGLSRVALKKLRLKYSQGKTEEREEDDMTAATGDRLDAFIQDLTLARAIQPSSRRAIDWTAETEGRVFMTGANGFLGSFLLAELLKLPQVKSVACLVRSDTPANGLARIKDAFTQYGLSVVNDAKIFVVLGNMVDENLGLSKEQFDELAQWASVVFHFAGYSNYRLPYSVHRPMNVLGLLEILRFSATGRQKAIHYCSSISACGTVTDTAATMSEDERPKLEAHMKESIGYTHSKFVAESMLWDAIENGFKVAIYRPCVVTGDSATGLCKTGDMVNILFYNCVRLGSFPRPPPQRFHIVPVDFVSAAIAHIALKESSLGHAFNIIHPNQNKVITLAEAFELLSKYTPSPLRCLSYMDWVREMMVSRDPNFKVANPILEEQLSEQVLSWASLVHMTYYETGALHQALSDKPELLEIKPMEELLKIYYANWLSQEH